jgi:hypothetical protein
MKSEAKKIFALPPCSSLNPTNTALYKIYIRLIYPRSIATDNFMALTYGVIIYFQIHKSVLPLCRLCRLQDLYIVHTVHFHSKCVRLQEVLNCNFGVASNAITCIPSFVKIDEMFRKWKYWHNCNIYIHKWYDIRFFVEIKRKICQKWSFLLHIYFFFFLWARRH